MTNIDNELDEIRKLANNVKYGSSNIIISEKLWDLQKKGLISRFEIKNNTMYVYCDAL